MPLQLLRGPGVPVWRSVFGEDGGIFLTEALASHGWGSIFTPYQGYLQVAARLVAEFVAMLPLSDAAVALAVVSAVVVSLLAVFVWSASAALLRGPWARVVVAVAPLVLPAAYETTSNATDLHWYLDYACFWALVVPHRRARLIVPAAVVAALAVTSDPLAALFVPLAVWRVVRAARRGRRRYRELVVATAFGLGLLVQLVLGVARQHAGQFQAAHGTDVPAIYGLRVAGSFLFGDRLLARAYGSLGSPFALACLVLVGAGVLVAVRRRSSRLLVVLATGYSVLWLCTPMLLRGTAGVLPSGPGYLAGSRYMVVPILLLVVACAAWLDREGARFRLVAGAAFLVVVAISYAMPSQRTHGPVWSQALASAAQRCAATGGAPRLVARSAVAPWGLPAGPTDVPVAVAPSRHPQWFVVAPCRSVVAAAGSRVG